MIVDQESMIIESIVVVAFFSAQPVSRMILEKNIAESKNAIEQRIIRSTHRKKSQRLSRQVLTQGANNDPNAQQSMTTKKPSSWNADHVTNMVTTGMNAAGQIATAFGNIFGKIETGIFDQSYKSFR